MCGRRTEANSFFATAETNGDTGAGEVNAAVGGAADATTTGVADLLSSPVTSRPEGAIDVGEPRPPRPVPPAKSSGAPLASGFPFGPASKAPFRFPCGTSIGPLGAAGCKPRTTVPPADACSVAATLSATTAGAG